MSIRVREELEFELRREASLASLDLGSLGREILSQYIAWERYSRKLGLMPMSKEFLKNTLEYLPDEVVERLAAKAGRNMMVDLTLLAEGSLTIEAFLEVFGEWLKACGMTVKFEREENAIHCVISHALGKKWSLFLGKTATAMCAELPVKTQSKFELANKDRTIVVHFKMSRGTSGGRYAF